MFNRVAALLVEGIQKRQGRVLLHLSFAALLATAVLAGLLQIEDSLENRIQGLQARVAEKSAELAALEAGQRPLALEEICQGLQAPWAHSDATVQNAPIPSGEAPRLQELLAAPPEGIILQTVLVEPTDLVLSGQLCGGVDRLRQFLQSLEDTGELRELLWRLTPSWRPAPEPGEISCTGFQATARRPGKKVTSAQR